MLAHCSQRYASQTMWCTSTFAVSPKRRWSLIVLCGRESADEIARKVGVSSGMVHNHFSKNDSFSDRGLRSRLHASSCAHCGGRLSWAGPSRADSNGAKSVLTGYLADNQSMADDSLQK